MKTMYVFLAAILLLTACSESVKEPEVPSESALASVSFSMKVVAPVSQIQTKAVEVIDFSKLRILAFKLKADQTYAYTQDVDLGTGTKESVSDPSKMIVKDAKLPIGTYKFVHVYGSDAYLLAPKVGDSFDNIKLTFTEADQVLFLENQSDFTLLPSYKLGVVGVEENASAAAAPVVKAELKRAMCRVDVMFIKAEKKNEVRQEVACTNVFSEKGVGNIQFKMQGTPTKIGLLNQGQTEALNQTFNYKPANLLMGTGASTSIKIGEKDYSYDAIPAKDVIEGSAYLTGVYLFAPDTATHLNVELTLTPPGTLGTTTDQRIIPLGTLSTQRNYITLVKVYVLSSSIFDANAQFEVTVDTAWDDAYNTEIEIN